MAALANNPYYAISEQAQIYEEDKKLECRGYPHLDTVSYLCLLWLILKVFTTLTLQVNRRILAEIKYTQATDAEKEAYNAENGKVVTSD